MACDPPKILREAFDSAVFAAQAWHCVPPFLPPHPKGRTIVIGAGKASAVMARAVETSWNGPLEGLVVTRYGHGVGCHRIEVVEAAHPVPDAAGLSATRRIYELAASAGPNDLVLCLISGGGSALLCMPPAGISLEDKQLVNRELLRCGASISEMNCVRRHLSAVKGGRLAAAAHPAKVVTLLMSDVPGDAAMDIASGPTADDPTSAANAIEIIRRYGIARPEHVAAYLLSGAAESIKPWDLRLAGNEIHLVATPQKSLEAASESIRRYGLTAHILGDAIEGEAREVGKVMAGIVRQIRHRSQPFAAPCVLLSGGETTVTIRGKGRGGRNVEYLLSLALALDGMPDVWAVAADTDGVDGMEEIAGAFLTPDTLKRAVAAGIRPAEALQNNDGHGFFSALGDSLITGPTLTNVNDFRAVYIGAGGGV
jgi:hydroxypyruvate reductase